MFIYGKGNDLTQIHNILRDEMNGDSERERERVCCHTVCNILHELNPKMPIGVHIK